MYAQPLDWLQDNTVFGTTGNETTPAIAIVPITGEIRAWCVCDESQIVGKLSLNAGATWSEAAIRDDSAIVRVHTCADEQFVYLFSWNQENGQRTLWRFSPRENHWSSARQLPVALGRVHPMYAACVVTDYEFQPDDPYLNICWIDSSAQNGYVQGWFAQSRDQGQTVRSETMIFEGRIIGEERAQVSMATAWDNDRERMFIATSLDRPGSIPHQIRLHVSEDEGVSWSESPLIDATTYDQTDPSVAAYGQFVLISYVRRTLADQPGDIFYTYSVDAGSTFVAPRALLASPLDEHTPRAVIAGVLGTFSVLYMADTDSNGATVYVRDGLLSAPDELSSPIMVSGEGEAVGQGGLTVATGSQGTAALWTRQFPLGDTDVCFDASWRIASSTSTPMPAAVSITGSYPNPFNGRTVLLVSLSRAQNVEIEVTDILGRRVKRIEAGLVAAGENVFTVDLTETASGIYFAGVSGSSSLPRRLVLIR